MISSCILSYFQDAITADRVIRLLEGGFHSTYLPCRVAALYGTLYVLEAGTNEATHQIIQLSTEYIMKQLTTITQSVYLLVLVMCSSCCCLPTPMTLASGGESDVPACGPPASFSVHLASSAVTLAGSVHKSRGDNVVRMWVQLKR